MALEALTRHLSYGRLAIACCALAVVCSTAAIAARYRSSRHPPLRHEQSHPIPYPDLELPLQVSGSQYEPLAWTNVAGWGDDDHLAAYKAFRTSCKPIAAQQGAPAESKALGSSLRDPCRIAKGLELSDGVKAKEFFEQNLVPLRISRLGEEAGFVTGYYEPVLDGSKTQTEVYNVPVYRRPSNLFVRGKTQASVGLPNSGPVYRKIGRRSSYRITTAPRSRTVRSPVAGSRSPGSRARPISCSPRSRVRRGSSSRTAPRCASITTRIMATPIRRSDAS